MRIPSLKLLTGFEAAARHGNFSRAADELHLSQSAVSHQIQQLEEHVGMALFRRVGRGVELTIAGEVLQRCVLLSLDTLRSGLGRIATYLDPGLVVLVCPAPLLHGWLQPQIDRLQLLIPDLCPMLSTDETARYIDEVNVDITIGDRPIQQLGLMEQPLLQDEWVVVASANMAAKLSNVPLTHHHLHTGMVCLEKSLTDDPTAVIFRNQLSKFRNCGIYDDQRLLLDAVLRNRGISCLSRLAARDDLNSGRLQILPDYPRVPGTTWWLSRVAGEPRAKIVLEVFNWLLAEAEQEQLKQQA
ncbi:LysR family transcriptional regulator [Undibacterium rugosum]|uniref:LysR family transcriptional regulator n=1 Tax=Undibacterium rugosum TaxID=2762291 RepID=A0A923I3X4_9BURK|nr:LysR family transcriptional regulator [Undibacterium rugosum]MBC3935905.1 LysR family transcriptional regulator [Undibacterium rugosum]MBR7779312.1 LysR family transcriptional regulator [Undibacterium rugosum]